MALHTTEDTGICIHCARVRAEHGISEAARGGTRSEGTRGWSEREHTQGTTAAMPTRGGALREAIATARSSYTSVYGAQSLPTPPLDGGKRRVLSGRTNARQYPDAFGVRRVTVSVRT